MIQQLSEFGKKIREECKETQIVHNAIKDEPISIDLIIKKDGSFCRFAVIEKIFRPAEAITAKKGKARLLLDKAEEVLCYKKNEKKHELFLKKLEEYKEFKELKPVFSFYYENKVNGIKMAQRNFEKELNEKERLGNIAFRVLNDDCRIHEKPNVIQAVIEKYEALQAAKPKDLHCSICGKNEYPVEDIPHGLIKKVPDGQTAGCALISYNENAFESYGLKGNYNSSVCTNCARTYVEGLNWLLMNGYPLILKDKNMDKEKEVFKYTNRRKFGSDTAILFWTKNNQKLIEINMLDEPDTGEVANLIDSVTKGVAKSLQVDQFYSCTLSGAAARIAIRDWIEISLFDFKQAIVQWFKDIAIERYNYDLKKSEIYYTPLYFLAGSAKNKKEQKDTITARIATYLWNSALKGTALPVWILNAVLKRTRVDNKGITPERAALVRIILNRNNKGGIMIKEKLDSSNTNPAYICGRIFAVLESIQRAALGKDINAGIRERFFSFASTNPSSAFGRLMKMSQNHLTKLKGEKAGLAVVLDKELQELFSLLNEFPAVFSLEEQGQFAIGYYHQKQSIFTKAKDRPELLEIVEGEVK